MATVILVRHGRTKANADGVLAGRTRGVRLDELGREQALRVGQRLAGLPVDRVVTSPLERTVETAQAVVGAFDVPPPLERDRALTECGYGDWTGSELKRLAKDPLWKVVQGHPSAASFPSGESIRDMQQRALSAVREWDATIGAEHGAAALWVAVSHGDVIKSVLADALGAHLDHFQRIVVDPASVSVISYTSLRPFVLRLNDQADLRSVAPPPRRRRRGRPASSDAAVGGGAGP